MKLDIENVLLFLSFIFIVTGVYLKYGISIAFIVAGIKLGMFAYLIAKDTNGTSEKGS